MDAPSRLQQQCDATNPPSLEGAVEGHMALCLADDTFGMLSAGARGATHVRGKDRVHPESFVTTVVT